MTTATAPTIQLSLNILDLPEGFVLRDLVLEARIGRGGFGVVYRAHRGGRRFAVKLPLLELTSDDEDARAAAKAQLPRIDREIASLKSLRHPSVITITEFFPWDPYTNDIGGTDGLPIIVMPYVDGPPLDKWVSQKRPVLRQLLAAFRAVAAALAEVHERAFVHRDVKPGNILMGADGPVLIDFGIARGGSALTATAQGTLIGTTEYFAPEYVAWVFTDDFRTGRQFAYGPPQDIFALGHTLYRLLTGVSAWAAYDNVARGPLSAEFIEVIKSGTIAPPSSVNPAVPPALDAIVLRLLARSLDERYRNCTTVVTDLAELEASLPVEALSTPFVLPAQAEARLRAKAAVVTAAANAARAAFADTWRYLALLRRAACLPFELVLQLVLNAIAADFLAVARDEPARELIIDAFLALRLWADEVHGNLNYPAKRQTAPAPEHSPLTEKRIGELFSLISLHRSPESTTSALLQRCALLVRAVRLELQFRAEVPAPPLRTRIKPHRPVQLLMQAGAGSSTIGARRLFAERMATDAGLPLAHRERRSAYARRRRGR